jgi:hypothetical protein
VSGERGGHAGGGGATHLVRLQRQLAGGRQDGGARAQGARQVALEPLHHGDDEGRGFARAGARHAHHVQALQDERHGAALDGGGQSVALAPDGA